MRDDDTCALTLLSGQRCKGATLRSRARWSVVIIVLLALLVRAFANAEIDWSAVDRHRTHWPFLRDRRVDAYNGLEQRLLD